MEALPAASAPALATSVRAGSEARLWLASSVGLAALLVLLQLPFTHLFLDDYIQRAMLQGSFPGLARPFWDLFRFTSTEPALRQAQVEHLLPWFGDPELRLAFLRPLSSALVALDVALFGQDARAQLLHSGLWYVALCAVAARWYQRHSPGLAGGVAGCAFALTASHQQAVTWFSARNALVAATFSLLALSQHERFREGQGARHRWLSVGFLALALAGGEGGLGGMALLVAYELSRPAPAALLARCAAALRQLVPVIVLAVVYLALHAALGYGAHASGAYLDPLSDPFGYLTGLPQRLLAALGVLVLTVPGEIWAFVPELRGALTASGVLAVGFAALWLRAHHAQLSARQHVALRYAALGTLGSLLPQLAGSLGARSFVLPSLGACALLGLCAQRLRETWLPAPRPAAAVWRALPVLMLLGLHLVGGPLQWWRSGQLIAGVQQASLERLAQLELDPATVASDTVLLLSAPDAVVGVYAPFLRLAAAEPLAAHWRILSLARRDHQVRRLSDHSFELKVLKGDLLDSGFAELFRHPKSGFPLGAQVTRDGLSAQVLELSERGQPTRIQFTTAHHLDDPRLRLYAWHQGRMMRLQLQPEEERTLSWVAPF